MELNRAILEAQIRALKEMAETAKNHGNSPIDGEMLGLILTTIISTMETINDELKEMRKITKEY